MELRDTGIKAVGEMPWGTHFCHFYKTSEDLLLVLVPFFKAGLENGEFCLWLTSEPLTGELALRSLKAAIPDLDQHLAHKNIEIVSMRKLFLEAETVDAIKVVSSWDDVLSRAQARGLAGMRVGGDQAWQSPNNWHSLCKVEKDLNRSLSDRRMIIMCSYPVDKIGADALLDVTNSHQFAIAVREGHWDMIESPHLRRTKAELNRVNQELEKKILDSQKYIESLSREEGLRRQFVSSLTHDIRNPLGTAQLSAQLLARKLPDNPHVQTLTDRVVFALQRADSLIQDLLDLNKILSNTPIPFHLKELDLYEILDQLVKRVSPAYGGQFILSCPHGIIGRWDRRTLTGVLDTLVTYCSIYAEEGTPIFINVETGPSISVIMHFKGEAPWVANRDRWALLWTLAKGIVSQHGGKLTADQMPTQEIRFRVDLPVMANHLAA